MYPVGTRVKYTYDNILKGYTGVVTGHAYTHTSGTYSDYLVRFNSLPPNMPEHSPESGLDLRDWGVDHDEIEPILYDGNKRAEWSADMPWIPENLKETV